MNILLVISQRTMQVKLAIALVGCYAVGMLTMWTVFGFANARETGVADGVHSSSH